MKNEIEFLEDYLAWKRERDLYPQGTTPEEYMNYLKAIRNQQIINDALDMVENYNKGIPWDATMVESLYKILRGE